jgi:stress response protein YsnF
MPEFRSKKRQDGSKYSYPILSSGRHSFHGSKPLKQKAGLKVPLSKEQLNVEGPKVSDEETKVERVEPTETNLNVEMKKPSEKGDSNEVKQ